MTPREELERIVDLAGIQNVMHLLSVICAEKADHIAVEWQDASGAKEWIKFASAIDSAIVKMWGRL